MKMQTTSTKCGRQGFTVVGFYPDSEQRFCEFIEASSTVAAEREIQKSYPGLAVCGVFRGKHTPVDRKDYVNFDT
ncbi:MAG: hypothetical protein GX565_02315 [Lentisphaerae bacterium]|nr:hypothetical protein [Lentisphaerota bacterium]